MGVAINNARLTEIFAALGLVLGVLDTRATARTVMVAAA